MMVEWGGDPPEHYHRQYAQTVGAHVGICALNYYWTAEVILSMARPAQKGRRAD